MCEPPPQVWTFFWCELLISAVGWSGPLRLYCVFFPLPASLRLSPSFSFSNPRKPSVCERRNPGFPHPCLFLSHSFRAGVHLSERGRIPTTFRSIPFARISLFLSHSRHLRVGRFSASLAAVSESLTAGHRAKSPPPLIPQPVNASKSSNFYFCFFEFQSWFFFSVNGKILLKFGLDLLWICFFGTLF